MALAAQGRSAEAVQAAEGCALHSKRSALMLSQLAHIHAVAGNPNKARAVLAEIAERFAYAPTSMLAPAYIALGDRDLAFTCLEQALEERCDWLVFLRVDPRLAPLRDTERFADIARRIRPETP
jgi:hypothetical protein